MKRINARKINPMFSGAICNLMPFFFLSIVIQLMQEGAAQCSSVQSSAQIQEIWHILPIVTKIWRTLCRLIF